MNAGWIYPLIVMLAIARGTRLVTADRISAPIRDRLDRRFGPDSAVAYWATCDYCASIWVGAIIAPIAIWYPDNRAVVAALLALAGSLAAGLIARLDAA